jgi:hypothetical protein
LKLSDLRGAEPHHTALRPAPDTRELTHSRRQLIGKSRPVARWQGTPSEASARRGQEHLALNRVVHSHGDAPDEQEPTDRAQRSQTTSKVTLAAGDPCFGSATSTRTGRALPSADPRAAEIASWMHRQQPQSGKRPSRLGPWCRPFAAHAVLTDCRCFEVGAGRSGHLAGRKCEHQSGHAPPAAASRSKRNSRVAALRRSAITSRLLSQVSATAPKV